MVLRYKMEANSLPGQHIYTGKLNNSIELIAYAFLSKIYFRHESDMKDVESDFKNIFLYYT
jgi:hypothetical protein